MGFSPGVTSPDEAQNRRPLAFCRKGRIGSRARPRAHFVAGDAKESAMNVPRRQFLKLTAGAATLPAFARIAGAQTYPTRPITLGLPFAAGGGGDALAR